MVIKVCVVHECIKLGRRWYFVVFVYFTLHHTTPTTSANNYTIMTLVLVMLQRWLLCTWCVLCYSVVHVVIVWWWRRWGLTYIYNIVLHVHNNNTTSSVLTYQLLRFTTVCNVSLYLVHTGECRIKDVWAVDANLLGIVILWANRVDHLDKDYRLAYQVCWCG